MLLEALDRRGRDAAIGLTDGRPATGARGGCAMLPSPVLETPTVGLRGRNRRRVGRVARLELAALCEA